jgi:hypothetical protein
MAILISNKFPKARKDHWCMSCDFLREEFEETFNRLTFSEKKAIVRAKRDNWQIKKGQVYERQFCTDGHDVWTFKARIEISAICNRLDLYPDI